MSREIKFRFWSGEKMFYDILNVMVCLKQQMYFNTMGEPMGYDHIGLHGASFMQFTGLKDKNGKEIYEGDIIKCSWLAELCITKIDCEANGEVKWDNNNPCFYIHLLKPYCRVIANEMSYEETDLPIYNDGFDDRYSFEVIGNIYQKPGS